MPVETIERADYTSDTISSADWHLDVGIATSPTTGTAEGGLAPPRNVAGLLPIARALGDPGGIRSLNALLTYEKATARQRQISIRAGVFEPASAAESQAALGADDQIDATHAAIADTARAVVRDATTDRERTNLLVHWVFENLRYERSDIEKASEILAERRGDCSELTRIFVALARSAKLSAREVVGLAYTVADGQPGFGLHAWAEVVIDGYWVPVDPTWNEELADATHIPIARGHYWWVVEQPQAIRVIDFEPASRSDAKHIFRPMLDGTDGGFSDAH